MAGIAAPNIVKEDLILYWDPKNIRSWTPGSDTVNGLAGTPTGSIFNDTSGSYGDKNSFTFDGTDDRIQIHTPDLGNTITVEMWAKFNTSTRNQIPFGWRYYTIYNRYPHIGFNTGTGDAYGISSTQISDAGATNSWTQWVYVMHSNVSYTNNKIYVNSVNQTLSAQNGASEAPSNRNFNSGYGNIGVWGASGQPGGGTSLFLLGECGNFKIYNRELSAQEVKQNYNALKGRFGL
jgi:hypothetical protein